MKFYWSWRTFPELAHIPQVERKKIWNKALSKSWRSWEPYIGFISFVVIINIGFDFLETTILGHPFIINFIADTLLAFFGISIFFQLQSEAARRYLRRSTTF